jgi:phage terminase Nu1 subunit (DNA packaging protein)
MRGKDLHPPSIDGNERIRMSHGYGVHPDDHLGPTSQFFFCGGRPSAQCRALQSFEIAGKKKPIMALPTEVSTADLEALFGVTGKTIAAWTKAGVLTRKSRGRFVLTKAVRAVVRHAKAQPKPTTTPGLESGAEARARLARLKADIAEAEYKRSKGELVDGGEILAQLDKRMSVYWREVARIPSVIMSTLSFVDREMAMLMGRELQRCLSNIGHGRPPNEDALDTDFDAVAEDALIQRRGQGVLSADGERIAAEAVARRAAPQYARSR